MASIPLPALAIKPPEQQDPFGGLQKLEYLRSLSNQQQLQQQELAKNQQALTDQQAMTKAMKGVDPTSPTFYDDVSKGVLTNGGSANAALAVQQHALTIKKTVSDIAAQDATTGTKNLDTYINSHKMVGNALEELTQLPDEQLHDGATAKVSELAKAGVIDPPTAQKALQTIQSTPDPNALRSQIDLLAKTSMGAQAVAEQAKTQSETSKNTAQQGEAEAATAAKNAEAAFYKAHPGLGAPGVPGEAASAADWLEKPENKGKTLSDYNIAMKKIVPAFNLSMGAGLLSDQGKDMAAENYFQTGQLPAGARSKEIVSSIINRAAELHPGGNLSGNKAAFEANKSSYENVTKTLDTLSAFEQSGLKNLKQFTDLADKLPDTGIPWLNTPVRNLTKNLVGDENMPAVEAARSVALREIARVTNDPKLTGALTDSARSEVSGLSPTNATFAQIKKVATILQQDMANVHQGLAQQKADIGGRLGIQSKDTGSATAPAPTATGPNGHKITVKDGQWVDAQTGQPIR